MIDAPSKVDSTQLKELSLALDVNKPKNIEA